MTSKNSIMNSLTPAELSAIASKKAVIGFDGAKDRRVRVIKKAAAAGGKEEYFSSLSDFGSFLSAHRDMNCSVELSLISEHFGGNAPFIANALSKMGADTLCIGTLGYPETDSIFKEMSAGKISYGQAAMSLALEFDDGKTFLEENPRIEAPFAAVKNAFGDGFEEMLAASDLIGAVNWSELDYAGELWRDMLSKCLSKKSPDKSKYVFFDLCDVSRRSDAEIKDVLHTLSGFSALRRTVLGLNKNEASLIGRALGREGGPKAVCEHLLGEFGLDETVLHTRTENSLYLASGDYITVPVRTVPKPAVLTGAGDHMSAAYCGGLLMGMEPEKRLEFATAYAAEYVSTGRTPEHQIEKHESSSLCQK